MPEPNTPNIGLVVPLTGDLVGTWGSAALNPDFVAIDGMLGGTQTIPLSGPATTVLTLPSGTISATAGPTQSQNAALIFTGTLTGNNIIQLGMPGRYVMVNLCLPLNYYVQVTSSGGGLYVGLPPGKGVTLYHDGTNVIFVDMPDVGSRLDLFGQTSMPAWMLACSARPYLIRDGSIYNVSNYPVLGAILGSTFGGNGVTTFGVPDSLARVDVAYDTVGTGRLTGAGGVTGTVMASAGGDENLQSHGHSASSSVSDPGHNHVVGQNTGGPGTGPVNMIQLGGSAVRTGTSTTGIGVSTSVSNTGNGGSQNVQPTIVSYLPLIKT